MFMSLYVPHCPRDISPTIIKLGHLAKKKIHELYGKEKAPKKKYESH